MTVIPLVTLIILLYDDRSDGHYEPKIRRSKFLTGRCTIYKLYGLKIDLLKLPILKYTVLPFLDPSKSCKYAKLKLL